VREGPVVRTVRRAAAALVVALVGLMLVGGGAHADDTVSATPLNTFLYEGEAARAEVYNYCQPGSFNGLGSCGRATEIRIGSSFSTSGTLTQPLELAHAFPVTGHFAVVTRLTAAADEDTTTGAYALRGLPIVAIAGRERSKDENYWVEIGGRVLWPSTGPNDSTPNAQRLALNAALSSGAADDALWLPFTRVGFQAYGDVQWRSPKLVDAHWPFTWLKNSQVGTEFGGVTSLPPLAVHSYLGPQEGIVANTYLELFTVTPSLFGDGTNVRLGVHGEVSLSSIWPANGVFPALGSIFVDWSPRLWISARVWVGAGVAQAPGLSALPATYPVGLRLQLYLPGTDDGPNARAPVER